MPENKVSLYAQTEALNAIMEFKEEMTEEEAQQYIEVIKNDIAMKSGDTIKAIRMFEEYNGAVKNEIARLKGLEEANKKVIDRIRKNIKFCMDNAGIDKIDTPVGKISFRKSTSVDVFDEKLIPKEYIKEKVTESVDKKAIGDALKAGEVVMGAKLEHKNNLQIK